MSRVIKFRGLNANNEFVYGLPSLDAVNSTAYYKEYSQRVCWIPESGGYANQPVKNGTLGQFTGLTDKNGVEIYEGDICIWYVNDLERLGEVYYHSQSFEMRSPSMGYIGWDANRGEIEVVGNIYQNPELLK
jgi:uncharacterized phage protein (TIGR01671 family)